MKKFVNVVRREICRFNYIKKLKSLRNSNKVIKVLFYVSENSKWTYQSLYEEFEKDEKFEPLVVVGVLIDVHRGRDNTRNNLEINYDFFKSRGMNVDYAYKEGNYIDLKVFNPDIIFYEQPWGLPKIYKPTNTSKYALTCYCSYAFDVVESSDHYKENFQAFLWKNFLVSEISKERYAKYDSYSKKNCVVTGYPKLDVYFELKECNDVKYWKDSEKIKIIYAPHHSFTGLKMATFKENGQLILNLAKNHPETTWIFKPHPQLKHALYQNNIMASEEIEAYFSEWEKIGNVCMTGGYFDIFKSSDMMITDCGSFLAEYLPTEKPLIRPVNPETVELNLHAQKIVEGYYNTYSNDELIKIFNQLLSGEDEKLEHIRNILAEALDFNEKSSVKILNLLKGEFND